MDIGLHYSFQSTDGDWAELIRCGLADIVTAEALGFRTVVFAEHHFSADGWLPRPMMLAAAAAAVTRRVRLGTNIVILPLHHPVAVAEEAAVLDVMSGGRAVLGVALGWKQDEYAGFGVPFRERARIFESSIDAVRRLLRGETVSRADGHYTFADAAIRPLPLQAGGPTFWMGALADKGIRRAARTADAWVMAHTHVDELRRQKAMFDECRAAAGVSPVLEQPIRREVFVGETDEQAWRTFAPGLRHEFGDFYRSLHPKYPEDDTIANLRRYGDGVWVVGSVETVVAELRRLEEQLGVSEVLVRVQLPGVASEAVRECLAGLGEVIAKVGGSVSEPPLAGAPAAGSIHD